MTDRRRRRGCRTLLRTKHATPGIMDSPAPADATAEASTETPGRRLRPSRIHGPRPETGFGPASLFAELVACDA